MFRRPSVPPSQRSAETWDVDFTLPDSWNIGVVVGPSGCGKSTLAREIWGEWLANDFDWPADKSLLDGFPSSMSIKDITTILSSVGFSSPPSWLRPFDVLSNGEKFRVSMARTLAESPVLSVVDEFTSVVDRTVAQIGSAAVSKAVRRRGQRFIALTCHYDILEWLEPDWVYSPHTGEFSSGRSLQRPKIEITVRRVHSDSWKIFRKYHYLNTDLSRSAQCFVGFWNDTPVAFSSWLHFPHPKAKNMKREHRTVTLPDYQGVGIGNALSEFCASVVKANGFRALSVTGNPAMIRHRLSSPLWKMNRPSGLSSKSGKRAIGLKKTVAFNRYTAGFEYTGPPADKRLARELWGGL